MSDLAAQWWVINGEALLDGLKRCAAGEDPELVYIELFANTTEGVDDV